MENYFRGVIFTNHAIDRLYEREIAQADAWYTFRHADGQSAANIPGATKFYKDYGQQRIEVIARENEKGEWVILSCWSKMVGTGQPLFPQSLGLGNRFLLFLQKLIFGRRS